MMKTYLLLPDLVAIACMALVLIRLRGKRAPDGLRLWIIGMLLIVAECVTRVLYETHLPAKVHVAMHVLSLETYLLAGVAFFQSATGRLRFLKHSNPYLAVCVVSHALLLFLYGAGLSTRPVFLGIGIAGLVAGVATATILGRPLVHFVCHAAMWIPILAAADTKSFRTCAYLTLFFAYGGTALAFLLTLPQHRRGRAAVVGAFFVWSLCFLSHPWIAEIHPNWLPVAEQIWNLQKFFVTFGLLIAALDEQMTTNEHRAHHDTLTGLPNRRFFEDNVPLALCTAARAETRLLLFNMDMNGFKQVNDVLGHDAGDQLLRQVGERLRGAVRATDTLARMGGDEFNLLIAGESSGEQEGVRPVDYAERASDIAAALREAVSGTPCEVEVDGHVHRVRACISIGWAIYPEDATTRDHLASIADKRMYADKRALRENRHGLPVPAMTDLWAPAHAKETAAEREPAGEPAGLALMGAVLQGEDDFSLLHSETACQPA